MVVFAGQGDPRRSMELLWRAPGPSRRGPGPKPGLSVELIVDTAITVADEAGMAALSMRAVGERLGRTAMALYTYVPGKSELVDLMYDRTLAELPGGYDLTEGWRAALMRWAQDSWEFYLRHPWMLQISQARPVLGPNEYRALEALLGVLTATGLDARRVRRAVSALASVVRGAAQTLAESRQAAQATGLPEEQWWYGRADALEEMAPGFGECFPLVSWLYSSAPPAGHDDVPYLEQAAREAFEDGLELVLDGIDAAIARA